MCSTMVNQMVLTKTSNKFAAKLKISVFLVLSFGISFTASHWAVGYAQWCLYKSQPNALSLMQYLWICVGWICFWSHSTNCSYYKGQNNQVCIAICNPWKSNCDVISFMYMLWRYSCESIFWGIFDLKSPILQFKCWFAKAANQFVYTILSLVVSNKLFYVYFFCVTIHGSI